jgi:16S rRNA (adenine1518-N6/adenine1519-N6)-dimethyltransferase
MRTLGQNFLVDTRIRDSIVNCAGVRFSDLVVEIGPGKGALTRPLAQRAGVLAAIEVDPVLAHDLRRMFRGEENVHIYQDDILSCDLRELVHEHSAELPKAYRALVVANLPYYITTPILNKLLSNPGLFSAFTLMVQLEVAQKLTAGPGSKGYGELSVRAQYFTEPALLFEVPPSAFDPPPSVRSAVVRMRVRPESPVDADPDVMFSIVGAGYGQRRKTLRNSLLASHLFAGKKDAVAEVLSCASIDGRRRAETLSLEEFAAIARAYARHKAGEDD